MISATVHAPVVHSSLTSRISRADLHAKSKRVSNCSPSNVSVRCSLQEFSTSKWSFFKFDSNSFYPNVARSSVPKFRIVWIGFGSFLCLLSPLSSRGWVLTRSYLNFLCSSKWRVCSIYYYYRFSPSFRGTVLYLFPWVTFLKLGSTANYGSCRSSHANYVCQFSCSLIGVHCRHRKSFWFWFSLLRRITNFSHSI